MASKWSNVKCDMCGKFLRWDEQGFCDKCIPKAIEEERQQGVTLDD